MKQRAGNHRDRDRGREPGAGFTIVEVVVAMFVLLIGMTSILGLLSFGAAMSRTANLRAAASMSIEAVVADLEEHLFPLVIVGGQEVAGEPREIIDRAVPGYDQLVYSAFAVPNPEDERNPPLVYRVDVELSWATGGRKRSKSFSTLLMREVPFGARLRQRIVEGIRPEVVEE